MISNERDVGVYFNRGLPQPTGRLVYVPSSRVVAWEVSLVQYRPVSLKEPNMTPSGSLVCLNCCHYGQKITCKRAFLPGYIRVLVGSGSK